MKTTFIIISSMLALISPIIYSHAILKGKAKPHRTTRFVLLVVTALVAVSLFVQHDSVAVWLAGVLALQAIFIFLLSIKYGMGGWKKIDLLCLAIALLGIVLWKTTANPTLALYCAISADFIGMIPTLIKTYRLPETEIWQYFLMGDLAAFFSLLALKNWNIQDFSYPIYILAINLLIIFLILRPKIINPFKVREA